MATAIQYWAHTPPDGSDLSSGKGHLLRDHIAGVTSLATRFATPLRMEREAEICGLLHDLGRYGELFQRRLRGLEQGIDHWTIGAWVALSRCHSIDAALAIQGHHIGLGASNKNKLLTIEPSRAAEILLSSGKRLSSRLPVTEILDCLGSDLNELPNVLRQSNAFVQSEVPSTATMLRTRLLFSCLVDADFLDTESHFQRDSAGKKLRQTGLQLDVESALRAFDEAVCAIRASSSSRVGVNKVREALFERCVQAAEKPQGTFTLTAPTGSGKTLSMLAFALNHARAHGCRRIILVLPFLSILDQIVKIYRQIFSTFPSDFILEHHSLAEESDIQSISDSQRTRRELLSENWDAPIVVTTNVQFFESLFAAKPARCRKLHNIANSVILFDEVQTIPQKLLLPTLEALQGLSTISKSTIVFATATQPPYDQIRRSATSAIWTPTEIVSESEHLFAQLHRVETHWPAPAQTLSCSTLVDRVLDSKSALVIVNLKKQANQIASAAAAISPKTVLHLSTSMCPAHRMNVFSQVYDRLKSGGSVHLISTQCVEAGVDLDFPTVFRAMAPLEAISQAAGRCNRNGNLSKGELFVFRPEDEGKPQFPSPAYQRGAEATELLIAETGHAEIDSPATIRRYYQLLYSLGGDSQFESTALSDSLRAGDFSGIAENYKMIDGGTKSVLVPYDRTVFQSLLQSARERGLSRDWFRNARSHAVSIYAPQKGDLIERYLEPLWFRSRKGDEDSGWFAYLEPSHYSQVVGLAPPESEVSWII